MEHLFKKLWENGESDVYPYHMPGHKRRGCGQLPEVLARLDITEIDGFDNLHHPEGILARLQERAAAVYGAEESFYLVNGSTAGILSAVSCALPAGGHILMCRNCHRSAYHAAYLRNLAISYLYPPVLEECRIFDGVTAAQVREALEREPDIGAVLIVSPTYEGRISDVGAIAAVAHAKGIPLIVDEAHGAHLGMAEGFAPNSCQAGADLVIHSVHKTLPALTQSALLHVNGSLVDRDKLKRFLHIYQSSSPSYLLMASIDNALRFIEEDGGRAFTKFKERFALMLERLSVCRYLRFLTVESGRQDVGKLVISVRGTILQNGFLPDWETRTECSCGPQGEGSVSMTGRRLYDILRTKYHLQPEMAADSYVLAMFTVNDSEEGYRRMEAALLEIDGGLGFQFSGEAADIFIYDAQKKAGAAVPVGQAWEASRESVLLEESVGRYAGEFVDLYPPGIPVLVPGERITEELCRKILSCVRQGLTVQGVEFRDEKVWISVLM